MCKYTLILAVILVILITVTIKYQPEQVHNYLTSVRIENSVSDKDSQSLKLKNRREVCRYQANISSISYQPEATTLVGRQENIGYINNKFGLYIYDVADFIEIAGDLVNSQGGAWGYVLIPYNVKDLDYDKWRKLFALLTQKQLIPIIQLWDVDPELYLEQTQAAAKFLNAQDWPIRPRYVSVYNEVNDARFWNGGLDPEGYAIVLSETINIFKTLNNNFFMLNGAFNATAPTTNGYLDQVSFMVRMDNQIPGIFKKLDGWASHSYPQPHYQGKPYEQGRQSIRGYEWELAVLKDYFGVNNLPVFITETGWPHAEGEVDNDSYYDQFTTADYIKVAYTDVWLKDERVVAVTPFTIRYDPPHDHFSWIKKNNHEVYPQFKVVQQLPKIRGYPPVLKKQTIPSLVCRSSD